MPPMRLRRVATFQRSASASCSRCRKRSFTSCLARKTSEPGVSRRLPVDRTSAQTANADSVAGEDRKRTFTGEKLDILNHAAADNRILPSDFRVLFVIAQ